MKHQYYLKQMKDEKKIFYDTEEGSNNIYKYDIIKKNIFRRRRKKKSKYLYLKKNLFFQKCIFYKLRCMNNTSSWLLELSKCYKNKDDYINYNKKLIDNIKFRNPFSKYKKIIFLFYKKKYKEAYNLLCHISTRNSSHPLKLNLLWKHNFFVNNKYNLNALIERIQCINKKKEINEEIHKKDKKVISQKNRINDKTNITILDMLQRRGKYKIVDKIKEIKKNYHHDIIINPKYMKYENKINSRCNYFLLYNKSSSFQNDFINIIGHNNNYIFPTSKRNKYFVDIHNNISNKNKNYIYDDILEGDISYIYNKDDQFIFHKKKKNNNKKVKKIKKRNIKKYPTNKNMQLYFYIKMLCLYMHSHSFSICNDTNVRNQYVHINMEHMKRKEILLYIIEYMKMMRKKSIPFDTHLYLLLSVAYYDLGKYHKSVLYVKKSIKKDYFNITSWIFFNNLICIEKFIDNYKIRRERKEIYTNQNECDNYSTIFINCKKNKTKKNIYINSYVKKKYFINKHNKLHKLVNHLFDNEFFEFSTNEYNKNIIMNNYNFYTYINPIINMNEDFFFKNNYFVNQIFDDHMMNKEGNQKIVGYMDRCYNNCKNYIENIHNVEKVKNKKTMINNVFIKYKKYLREHNFKNNFMTLFGFAHFCSLNNKCYQDAICIYKYLIKILRAQNNLYISGELAKLYYFCGQKKKSLKYFNKLKIIIKQNTILKKQMMNKYLIYYYCQYGQSKNCKNKIIFLGLNNKFEFYDKDKKHIMCMSMKKYKAFKRLIIPKYFSDEFIYVELLANIYFLNNSTVDLFILAHSYEKKKKKFYDEKLFYILGKYYSLNKNYENSITFFKKGIQKNKYHIYSYISLAQEYFLFKNNVNISIYILLKVLFLYFNNTYAWYSLGQCLQYKKHYTFCIFSYEKALFFNEDISIYYFLSASYLKRGDIYNYIYVLIRGWNFKKNILFSSMIFSINLNILNNEYYELIRKYDISNPLLSDEKKKEFIKHIIVHHYYKKTNNNCLLWCIIYLKGYFKKITKNLHHDNINISEFLKNNSYEMFVKNNFFLGGDNIIKRKKYKEYHKMNLFFKNFNLIYYKNTNYLYFIQCLRNSPTVFFNAVTYLANYCFYNKQLKSSLKLLEILWDVKGSISSNYLEYIFLIEKMLRQEKDRNIF
ncbi:conserved Plasmodium protein, unknown function [Plasmodium gaboni]|uniref:Tetratricopeptide repeat protein n=1 Tax=Plasmodium gaboni TaxID=647221 RepID=A0ABY1UT13_9APIC|nr:conserved Plasmodium protein, unknown function [Plasmodium gaboni]